MANGINPIASLQGRVNASGALVITIGAVLPAPTGAVGEGRGPIATLQGRVTANNELVIRQA